MPTNNDVVRVEGSGYRIQYKEPCKKSPKESCLLGISMEMDPKKIGPWWNRRKLILEEQMLECNGLQKCWACFT